MDLFEPPIQRESSKLLSAKQLANLQYGYGLVIGDDIDVKKGVWDG